MDGRKWPLSVKGGYVSMQPFKGAESDSMKWSLVVVGPRAGRAPAIDGFKAESDSDVTLKTAVPVTSSTSCQLRKCLGFHVDGPIFYLVA
jgi:hypothetical protein